MLGLGHGANPFAIWRDGYVQRAIDVEIARRH
jgi:hypothetical protein